MIRFGSYEFEHCYINFTEVHVTELIILKDYNQVNARAITIIVLTKFITYHTISVAELYH